MKTTSKMMMTISNMKDPENNLFDVLGNFVINLSFIPPPSPPNNNENDLKNEEETTSK